MAPRFMAVRMLAISPSGGDDHGAAGFGEVVELREEGKSVHHGHVDIAQDEIDMGPGGEGIEGFFTLRLKWNSNSLSRIWRRKRWRTSSSRSDSSSTTRM